jgi:hypothetical protein
VKVVCCIIIINGMKDYRFYLFKDNTNLSEGGNIA